MRPGYPRVPGYPDAMPYDYGNAYKAYCLYIPLALITPRAFPDKERLIGFLKWYMLIVVPVATIALYNGERLQIRRAAQTVSIQRAPEAARVQVARSR